MATKTRTTKKKAPLSVKVGLRWADFYDLMDKVWLEEEYDQFEDRLIAALSKEFPDGVKFTIDWMD